MPKLKFALDRGSEKRVQVEYRGFYSDLSVRLDGQDLGKFASRKELKAGRDFPLPDGSTLNVQLAPQATGAQLEVRRNGEALPGSAGDPEVRIKIAYGIIYFIAGLNLVLGLLGSFVTSELLQRLNAGPALIIEGLAYCALGLWFQLRASRIALAAAMALFAVDGAFVIIRSGFSGVIVVRAVLLMSLWRGFTALRETRGAASRSVAAPGPT